MKAILKAYLKVEFFFRKNLRLDCYGLKLLWLHLIPVGNASATVIKQFYGVEHIWRIGAFHVVIA